jgi:cytidylate kinase
MDASLDERARRRLTDEVSAGRAVTFTQVRESIASRDKADNTGHRSIEPEQAAVDAVLVDTDGLTESEVIIKCVKTYEEANDGI